MIITVFGGSGLLESQPAYQDARELGFALGKAGHSLLTGGYVGVMEAVSLGGHEAGAHVIGATCAEIERSHLERKPNPYLDEEWRTQTLAERLVILVDRCDLAIAMPGGVGTLVEITYMWNELIIAAISPKPLIMVGSAWQKTFAEFFEQSESYIPSLEHGHLTFTPDVPSALEFINAIPSN